MTLIHKTFFSARFKLILTLVAFLSIGLTTALFANQARAISNLSISYFVGGVSPNSYGPELFTTGEYRYIYDVGFFSDGSNIDPSTVAYEIDSEGRQSLAGNVTYDGGTEVDTHLIFNQIPYADGLPHTITFSASTVDAQEVTDVQSLQPAPDTTNPDIYFDTSTSGTTTNTDIHFTWSVSDNHLSDYGAYLDNGAVLVSPNASGPDYANYDIDLAVSKPQALDGNNHTFRFTATDPYGNTAEQSFTFRYSNGIDTTPPVLTFTDSQTGATTNPIYFAGNADDLDSTISQVQFTIDGGSRTNPSINNGSSSPSHRVFYWTFDYLSAGDHQIIFYATDSSSNESSQTFNITVPGSDTAPPNFNFTTAPAGKTKKPLTYAGTAQDDGSMMGTVEYTVDGGSRQSVTVDYGNSTSYLTTFSADLSALSDGVHQIIFYASDSLANETSQTFDIDLDSGVPTCTASWSNQTIPHYSKIIDYPNITCTDNIKIVDAQYNVYHVVQGTLQAYADHHILPQDGTNDEASETYDLHVDLSAFGDIDGVVLVQFKVTDEYGNESYDYDPVTIDTTDNTAPIINLDEITPDPLTDSTPTITGSCRDNTEKETNTFISNMSYKIGSGSYTTIPLAGGGSYNDSYTESFSVELPEMTDGTYTVTVSCADGASHTTTASDTFTIQNPLDPVPGQFTYTESFDDTSKQDIPNSSNMVWGNGKLRLKEDITTSRTLINNANICGRYEDCNGLWQIWQDPVNTNVLWYYQGGKIYTYNTQTQVNTLFDYETDYGISPMGSSLHGFALGVYGGKEYLLFSDIYSLSVVNLTDHTSINNMSYGNVGAITPDFSRGRLAVYLTTDTPSGQSNLAYLDLNGNENPGDDIFTRIPLATLNSTSFLHILIDPSSNAVYSGAYQSSLFKWNDHNNPADYASYTITSYDGANYDSVFSAMTLDPQNRLIFGTANNANPHLFVVSNDGGTPFDASDDTVTQLASPQELGYRSLYGIQYIAGQNGVGDQLLLRTETDNPIYVNFNSTYTNHTDDTIIELESRGGIRPGPVSGFMQDYNTMYVQIKNQGFYKVDLTRGWQNSGEAVALPTRPPQQLVVDNFTAEATVGGPIAYAPGSSNSFLTQLGRAIVPLAQAADTGIHYYVSTDGGVTWTEVTLGQLQQLQQTDYRVKFKISMNEVGGATPVLNSYSLAYAGYSNLSQPVTTTGLSVTPSVATTTSSGSFNVTIEAVDLLGYKTASYNGSASISLINSATNTVVSGLNVSSANIANGTVTVSGAQISSVGTYKIRVTSGSFSQDSSTITVSGSPTLDSPSLAFWADTYKVKKGEDLTLHWNSTNLDTFIINPGDSHLTAASGHFIVHPQQTTTYIITGDGSHGSISNSLTVVVEGEVSSNTSTTTPTATVAAKLASSPGLTPLIPDTVNPFVINSSSDQTIIKGEKATVSWDIQDADEVSIDFPDPHVVSSKGSFEFFPTKTTTIILTAKKGTETIQKKIVITVLDAPILVQQFSRAIQEQAPWATPIISKVVQGAKALPAIGLSVAAVAEIEIVGLLVITVVSQAGFIALLNGKTILNLLATAGLLPAKQHKGFVHTSKTGIPIPFAAITVYEGAKQMGLPFITLVSDMYGAYLEPYLPKGLYVLIAAHGEHSFPTLLPRPKHLSLRDFYKGETLSVASNKDRPALLIPMDEISNVAQKHALKYRLALLIQHTLSSLAWTVYPLSIVSLIALWLSPGIFNLLIVIVYLIVLTPKLLKLFRKPILKGKVLMDLDRKAVSNATITLSTTDGNVVAVSKSNAKGEYEFFAPKGNYALNVVSNNLMWKELNIGTLYTIKLGDKTKPLNLTMQKIDNPFGI